MADIPKLILDPQNEETLVQIAFDRIREASDGTLTDFRPGSPLAAMVEGQVFCIAELLYYLNLLPEALALETFRLLGVTRNDGTKARGYIRVLLQAPLGNLFTLPSGYQIPFGDSFFITLDQLVIPAGSLEADVPVEAKDIGSLYNVPALGLVVSPGLNFVQTIYNPEPFSGGTDLEPLVSTITRAQSVLRSRQVLISTSDYESAATEILGGGRAICVPLLAADKLTEQPGQCHVFLCDSLGQVISQSVAQQVKAELSPRVFAASQVWVSSVALLPLTIEVTCLVSEVSEAIANDIAKAIESYTSPLTYPWGDKLKYTEVLYYTRTVPGVLEVDSVRIEGDARDFLLPNRYTCPVADTIIINLIQTNGVTAQYIKGQALADVD